MKLTEARADNQTHRVIQHSMLSSWQVRRHSLLDTKAQPLSFDDHRHIPQGQARVSKWCLHVAKIS